MGRGIPTAFLGRKLKTGAHANKTDAGAPPKAAPKAVAAPKAPPKAVAAPAAPKEAAPEEAKPDVSMENTKAELITAAKSLGLDTKGLTKAQLLAAIAAE
jgi:hypothetical protein